MTEDFSSHREGSNGGGRHYSRDPTHSASSTSARTNARRSAQYPDTRAAGGRELWRSPAKSTAKATSGWSTRRIPRRIARRLNSPHDSVSPGKS